MVGIFYFIYFGVLNLIMKVVFLGDFIFLLLFFFIVFALEKYVKVMIQLWSLAVIDFHGFSIFDLILL